MLSKRSKGLGHGAVAGWRFGVYRAAILSILVDMTQCHQTRLIKRELPLFRYLGSHAFTQALFLDF